MGLVISCNGNLLIHTYIYDNGNESKYIACCNFTSMFTSVFSSMFLSMFNTFIYMRPMGSVWFPLGYKSASVAKYPRGRIRILDCPKVKMWSKKNEKVRCSPAPAHTLLASCFVLIMDSVVMMSFIIKYDRNVSALKSWYTSLRCVSQRGSNRSCALTG